jgi:hypothetical protein
MRAAVRAGLCAALLSHAAQKPPLELTKPAGVDFEHRNSPTSKKYLIETMGGGVAAFDYNNDGLLDVFLVNGGRIEDPQKLPPDYRRREPAYWNRLYRQNPDGTFTDVTAAAGLANARNDYGMGVAVGDYDNDGHPDIYITNFGQNRLYHNNGDGTFTDVTEAAGVGGGGWSVSAGFFDYDNDGRLDLFVSRYLNWDFDRNILCGTPFHSYCRPDKYEGIANLLFHNEGAGRFRDVTAASGLAAAKGKGMGVAFNDYDGDGLTDVFVSNDGMAQFLFHNKGDGTFEERAMDAGVALSDDGRPYAGLGVAFADYDNDGRPDILVTNLALEKYALYRNEGGGHFAYASLSSGLAGLSARSSGWGVGFADFDNDGWKDVFVSQGHVLDNVERINSALRYREAPALFRNDRGKFERVELTGMPALAGRGAAIGDFNNDGAMDAIVAVLGGRPVMLRGRPNGNHWITLKLIGARSNRDGAGAKVRAGDQWAYCTTSGSYLSAGDGRVHFGLGSRTRADIEIVWPCGRRQMLANIPVNRVLTVKEPE